MVVVIDDDDALEGSLIEYDTPPPCDGVGSLFDADD
jgi:hypothetical protein